MLDAPHRLEAERLGEIGEAQIPPVDIEVGPRLPGILEDRGEPDVHQATSKSPAAPIPPPMHMVQTTYFAPRRLPSISACPTIRAPDIP